MKNILEETMEELNDEQKKALLNTIKGGHTAVIAVPGSGKTKTIVETAKALILTKVRADKILLLTFTRKAANEIKSRIESSLEKNKIIANINVYTFHSFALRMLKTVGIQFVSELKEFSIIDEGIQKKVYYAVFENMIENLKNTGTFENEDGGDDLEKISFLKERKEDFFKEIKKQKVFSKKISDYVNENNIDINIIDEDDEQNLIYHSWRNYEMLKSKNKKMDFEDILTIFRDMLKSIPIFRAMVKTNFQYIIIDEYQDTSDIQMEIINLIKKENLTIVGDDAQSIYSWRNANIDLITNFEKEYEATLIKMNKNYRSGKKINELANKIIENNKNKIDKIIETVTPEEGIAELKIFQNEKEEIEYITESFKGLEGTVAVLFRNNKTILPLEEEMKKQGLLYSKKGISDYFSDGYIKLAISYLNFHLEDSNDNLTKILSFKKGVGEKTIQKIKDFSMVKKTTMLEIMKEEKKTKELAERIEEFLKMKEINKMFDFIKDKFIGEMKGDIEASTERYNNFAKLMSQILKNDIINLKEDIFNKIKEKTINLMTVHSSKGLEFDTVFLLGMEEGNFPSTASIMSGNIEEERRLCLVAITRAKRKLIMTFSRERNQKSYSISSFLGEMQVEGLDILDKTMAENSKALAEANSYLLGLMKELKI